VATRSADVPGRGGVVYLEPVEVAAGATAVRPRSSSPRPSSTAAWPGLVGTSPLGWVFLRRVVLVSDRLAARVVRSARGLADAPARLGDTTLTCGSPARTA
jgi:hypothetical protein